MSEERPFRVWHYRLVWLLAILSLAFNVGLIVVLLVVRNAVGDLVVKTNDFLFESLAILDGYEGYDLPLNLNEPLLLENAEDVLFDQVLQVPVSITVPISESVPFQQDIPVAIRESIFVQDTIEVPLELGSQTINLEVPVALNVPVNLDVVAPVDTEVPVNLEVPLNFTLEAPVKALIPLINQNYDPLRLQLELRSSVPVPMDALLEDVRLTPMLKEMQELLAILEVLLLLPPAQN